MWTYRVRHPVSRQILFGFHSKVPVLELGCMAATVAARQPAQRQSTLSFKPRDWPDDGPCNDILRHHWPNKPAANIYIYIYIWLFGEIEMMWEVSGPFRFFMEALSFNAFNWLQRRNQTSVLNLWRNTHFHDSWSWIMIYVFGLFFDFPALLRPLW